jgi:hypothetical protein
VSTDLTKIERVLVKTLARRQTSWNVVSLADDRFLFTGGPIQDLDDGEAGVPERAATRLESSGLSRLLRRLYALRCLVCDEGHPRESPAATLRHRSAGMGEGAC